MYNVYFVEIFFIPNICVILILFHFLGIEFGLLPEKTLCLSAKQHASTHYNVHSLYGHFEAKVTHL